MARTVRLVADVDGVEDLHAPGEGDDTIAAIAEVVGRSWLLDQLVD